MDTITMYLAIVFFCQGTQCGVMSVETPYSNRAECMSDVAKAEEKFRQDPKVTIVEGRCASFKNGLKS
jgi:hypothetical protein